MSNTPAVSLQTSTIRALIERYKPIISRLLARSGMSEDTYAAQLGNAFRASPKLLECDPETVLGAALRCAQLALPPNDGQNLCWIVPYGRSATFQLGYGGVLEIARRTSPGVIFEGDSIYPGDLFEREPFRFVPAYLRTDTRGRRQWKREGEPYAWFVRARFPDGRDYVHTLDRAGVEYHRAFSKAKDGDAWSKSYNAMALKSVVLDMRRWLPASVEWSVALASDGAVIDVRDLADEAPRREIEPGADPDQLTLDDDETVEVP